MDYFKTWKHVMLKPSDFYRNMPTTGGYVEPLTFAGISIIISGTIITIGLMIFLGMVVQGFLNKLLIAFVLIVVNAFVGLIIVLIESTILYKIYQFLEGTGTYEGTLRFTSYTTAVAILITGIPFLGWILSLYAIYLSIVGGMIVHNVSIGKAVLATVINYAVVFVLGLLFWAIISSLFFGIMSLST